MKRIIFALFLTFLFAGCAQNVWFEQIDESYEPEPNPAGKDIVFSQKTIDQPHRVLGIIQAELEKDANRGDLNKLLIEKANEIGADGLMAVEYDISKSRYVEKHHHVVRSGPYRRKHHVIRKTPRVDVDKTASAIAIKFKEK
ncbi:MAG: membrane lipoprotein lipid attachment site-containing protein [Candidatus Zixiibacteriota bacterium]